MWEGTRRGRVQNVAGDKWWKGRNAENGRGRYKTWTGSQHGRLFSVLLKLREKVVKRSKVSVLVNQWMAAGHSFISEQKLLMLHGGQNKKSQTVGIQHKKDSLSDFKDWFRFGFILNQTKLNQN